MTGPDDEAASLWAWAMREVKPHSLRQRLRSSAAKLARQPGDQPSSPALSPPLSASTDPTTRFARPDAAPVTQVARVAPAPASRPVPQLSEFDRKKARKIARGGQQLDARIDLHGLRQSEAQDVLTAFLLRCYANGCRTVLVITGKGRTDRDAYYEPFDMFAAPDRGVLKTSVPRWFAEPDLRAIVSSYTTAAQKHGGDGALYVQLRSVERT
jgi:DNA-nicking Smr family endonuclease